MAAHLGHDLRDCPHAANAVTPRTLVAIHLAKDVVQQHISAARRVGASIIADHRVKTERCLDRFAFEPAVEEAARRFGEKFKHIALLRQVQFHQPAPLHGCIDQRLDTAADIGRRFQRKVAQDISNALKHFIICR